MSVSSKSVCEQDVFNELFKTHSRTIRNHIYYKCGDPDQAEDIMQESFIRLWNNCKKVILEKARAFLYKVSTNLFLNQVEHQKVRLAYSKLSHRDRNHESPDFILEEKEFMIKLQNAIGDLSEAQREVFLLNRIDKKTYNEIAEMLGISVKAVEKRMHNALKKLRKIIKNI
ncbi:RNA polymerase sigma factor [Aquimarina litoralis]|uniref:RNA polymerase sigma-70 factor, ECF subfamily n=1 Tax=Aquimarina litoralis TaxID=584605 RepID=A0ABP3TPT2_9FLAO|nr:RNA polymerase sigma factor [uncultured Aquimarina sp.]